MHVTEKLNRLLRRSQHTQQTLAHAIGLKSQSSIQRLFNSRTWKKTTIPADKAIAFAKAMQGRGSPPVRLEEVLRLSEFNAIVDDLIEEALDARAETSDNGATPQRGGKNHGGFEGLNEAQIMADHNVRLGLFASVGGSRYLCDVLAAIKPGHMVLVKFDSDEDPILAEYIESHGENSGTPVTTLLPLNGDPRSINGDDPGHIIGRVILRIERM